jgi:hypothetical protein
MDTAALVKDGKELVQMLDAAGFPPRFAMWIYNVDADAWRLWIVPSQDLNDEREFYRRVATLISESRDKFSELDAGQVDLRKPEHPAVKGVRSLLRLQGLGDIRLSNNTVNGFFIPDGIALRVDL